MAVYYFGTEKLNERDFPSNRKYVIIVQPHKPSPDKGKKKLSTEQRKKYEHDMEQYNKCIALLENGHVDIYNNYLEMEDSDKFAVDVLLDGEFKKELNDNNLQWVGSSNQRIIDVQKSLIEDKVVLHQQTSP